MKTFSANDVTVRHEKLAGGRGHLRLSHRPTGLFVDGDVMMEPVMRLAVDLLNQLRDKVHSQQNSGGKKEAVQTPEERP